MSHFDRDTWVAVLSSHEAISPGDANRIIGQIERVRWERSPSERLVRK